MYSVHEQTNEIGEYCVETVQRTIRIVKYEGVRKTYRSHRVVVLVHRSDISWILIMLYDILMVGPCGKSSKGWYRTMSQYKYAS